MTITRKIMIAALGIVIAASLSWSLLMLGSEWQLHRMPRVPDVIRVPPPGDAEEGARLAFILGCRGCHGMDLSGRENCFEEPGLFRLTCPSIIEARERYDDQALVTLLRHGRKLNGVLVDFMPWDMYAQLTDSDLGHVLAFLRAAPSVEAKPLSSSSYSLAIRWQMLWGEYPWQNDLADYDSAQRKGITEKGRYLASISCPECHAPDLRGYEGDSAPNLVVAKAYSPEAFARLMSEGITLGGGESATGLMTAMGRTRFSHFRPDEVAALKAYLDERTP